MIDEKTPTDQRTGHQIAPVVHTPGDWELRDTPGAGLEIYAKMPRDFSFVEVKVREGRELPIYSLTKGRDVLLAYARWVQFEPVEWDAMQRANGLLMAAAPALLAACKALLCMMDRGGEPRKFEDNLTWRENDEKAHKMAADAIAKATGSVV